MQRPLGNLEVCLAQKANMEAIFHSVADGIVTVDIDRKTTNVNRSAQQMLAVTEADALDRPVGDVLNAKLWDVDGLVAETIEKLTPAQNRENVIALADGRELRVLIGTSHLVDQAGNLAGGVVIVRDITEVRALEARLETRTSLHGLVGRAHAMQEIYSLIEQVAPTDSTVLIQGESGTGKELVADAIHRASRRQAGPFIKINCSALSESLLESELFGHVKGAFTGALYDKKGRFELASGGTLFLDEIGDLTERIQVKLLRVLQEREIERVGDAHTISIDVRILTATHRPLRKLVDEGRFREDLFFRLNVIPVRLPPLRERREDIPELAALFLSEIGGASGKPVDSISPDALRALMDHRWPGNVRELRNAVEHGVVKSRGKMVLLEDLPPEVVEETARIRSIVHGSEGEGETTPANRGREEVLGALEAAGWNRGQAAEILGVDRTTLWRRMKKLGIEAPAR